MKTTIRLLACSAVLAVTISAGLTLTTRLAYADIVPVDETGEGGVRCQCTDAGTMRYGIFCWSDGRRRCCPDGCTIDTQ
jgi:hypothetical protein